MTASTCIFKTDVIPMLDESRTFRCDREPLEGKDLCLFHDKSYLKDDGNLENKDKVLRKLNDRIDKCISNNEPL